MNGSVVDRRLDGRLGRNFLSRLSVLPWTLRGGVRGWDRGGGSVGRSAAGRYGARPRSSDGRFDRLRGRLRKWLVGRLGCGEAGELGDGV